MSHALTMGTPASNERRMQRTSVAPVLLPEHRSKRSRGTIDLLEAIYTLAGSTHDWLTCVVERADPIARGVGLIGLIQRVERDGLATTHAVIRGGQRTHDFLLASMEQIDRGWLVDHFGSPMARSGSFVKQLAQAGMPAATFATLGAPFGVADVFGQMTNLGDGHYVTLLAPSPTLVAEPRDAVRRWQQISAHLGAGLRLRRRLDDPNTLPELILRPSGELCHVEPSLRGVNANVVSAAVRAIDEARSTRRREHDGTDGVISLWRGLVSGRWSLADRIERGGQRFVVAYRNDLDVPRPATITRKEAAVARWAAGGAGLKEIAYALGVSVSTVHETQRRVMRKLRVDTRAELVRLWEATQEAPLAEAVRVPLSTESTLLAAMSPAEREVAGLVVAETSVAEIAQRRSTSIRTVTNQLATVYEKLGVRSRAELAALLASS